MAIVHSVMKATRGKLEIFHRLVHFCFCLAAIDPAVLNRPIQTGAHGFGARVDTVQQFPYLLIADSRLCRRDNTDTREREHSR